MKPGRRKSVCDYRVKELVPHLAAAIIIISVAGYLGGFIIVDLSARSRNDLIKQQQQIQQINNMFVVDALSRKPDRLQLHPGGGSTSNDSRPNVDRSRTQCILPCRRRGVERSSRDGSWYDFSQDSFQLHVYTAFFDSRDPLSPAVRIIAVSNKVKDSLTPEGDRLPAGLTCRLCYEDGTAVDVAIDREPKPIGYGWYLNSQNVREYIYSCPCAPGDKVPSTVKILFQSAGGEEFVGSRQSTFCIPVQIPKPAADEIKRDVAICAGIVRNEDTDAYKLIEWIELQRMLGVSHVSLYVMEQLTAEKPIDKVLSHYSLQSSGSVVDVRMTSLIGAQMDNRQYLVHASPVINDCIYRNMDKFRFIMVIDVNEVIVPQGNSTQLTNGSLTAMLTAFQEKYPDKTNYVFWNSYHFTDRCKPEIGVSPYLNILRCRYKSELSEYGHSVKSIIHGPSCLSMHNQYCWTSAPGVKSDGYMEIVDPNVAVKQTYKNCDLGNDRCAILMNVTTVDNTMLPFRLQVMQRVSDVVSQLLGHDI